MRPGSLLSLLTLQYVRLSVFPYRRVFHSEGRPKAKSPSQGHRAALNKIGPPHWRGTLSDLAETSTCGNLVLRRLGRGGRGCFAPVNHLILNRAAMVT